MIDPLADNIVLRHLPRIIRDAEALMGAAAWRDLPAGCRIIGIEAVAGLCFGSGHRWADANGFRPGSVAVGVAAKSVLLSQLKTWHDELPAALGEAALLVEYVAVHEFSHSLVYDIDGPAVAAEAAFLRKLPCVPAGGLFNRTALETARGHDARWAAGCVILAIRCKRHRPQARHRWAELLAGVLRAYGIDSDAVADAVGDIADEMPLRELLAAGGSIADRVAAAIPDETQRAALIAARHDTSPTEPGHVATAVAGED